jgi:hypothetical protein
MKVAIGLYETKHATETICFATSAKTLADLPPMTNEMLADSGALDPDIEGDDATETFTWQKVISGSTKGFPILKTTTERTMYLNVDHREFATILAGLRYWQRKGIGGATKPHCLAEYDIASDAGHLQPLGELEIDALCERMNCEHDLEFLTIPNQLLAALERASAACEERNDYDWVGEAETAIDAAYKIGMGSKLSPELKRLLMAEIDNESEGGDTPATLESAAESLAGGYKPCKGYPVAKVKKELAALITEKGNAPAARFVSDADWKERAQLT